MAYSEVRYGFENYIVSMELIMNYIQTLVSINKVEKTITRYDDGVRTCNPHDSLQAIRPLCYEYLLVIGMCIQHFKCNKIHDSELKKTLLLISIIVNTERQQSQHNTA